MKPLLIILLLALANPAVVYAAANLYSVDLRLEGTRNHKAVPLTPEIVNHGDVFRIVCRTTGEEAPYFIHSGAVQIDARETFTPLQPLETIFVEPELGSSHFLSDFAVQVEEHTDPLISLLRLIPTDARDFLRQIDVLGSYDRQHWHEITSAQVYSISESSQLEISLQAPMRYRYYRLRVPGSVHSENIEFTVTGVYNIVIEERAEFLQRAEANFTTAQENGTTNVTLHGLEDSHSMRNIRVTGLELETPSYFSRGAFTSRYSSFMHRLHRLYFQDTLLYNLHIPFPGNPGGETLTFFIQDNDDRPIEITRIWVEYARDYLIFRADPDREYNLLIGGELHTPRYDIENYRHLIVQEGFDTISFSGDIILLEEGEVPRDFSWLFNIAIAAAGIVLTVVGVASLRKRAA